MGRKVNFYLGILLEKLDQHIASYLTRIELVKQKKWDQVEYLDEMILDPLGKQIHYLAVKLGRMYGG